MSQINDPKIAFAYLRPACVVLTKEPTLSSVETLSAQLKEVDDVCLQQLQDYVLFPLRFVLKVPGPKKDNLVQAVANAIGYILENTCVQSWNTLHDLFSELCLCLCCPTDPGKPIDASEELKLSILKCLDALIHAAYGDIVIKLYEPVMLPGLGAAVSLLLALAEKEKSREIQGAALKLLLVLIQQCDCSQEHIDCTAHKRAIGRIMASFLPGISTAVARIITGDMRQGHGVTVSALKVWSGTVCLVMEDSQLQCSAPVETASPELGRVGQLLVLRTEEWVKSTAARLCVLLKKIVSCTSAHRHWRVRLALVELADLLLQRCGQSLAECMGSFLDALVGAINDDEPRIRDRNQQINCGDDSSRNISKTFTDVLSENLHSLCTSLPRLMRTSDDQKKLFILNVFLGYVKLLGPLVSVVLASAAHLERVSKALMQVLELDVMDVRIVEEKSYTDTDIESGSSAHVHRKHFMYFTDDRIFSVLMEICRTLGYYGNLYLLTDHFLDLYRQSSVYRKQAAMVLNEIIRGAAGIAVATGGQGLSAGPCTEEDLRAAVESIIEEYISVNNWHLMIVSEETDRDKQDQKVSFNFSPSPTLRPLPRNIWQLCVQLEGISCFAQALGQGFCPLLMTSLYPVFEKAGEENLLVSQAALDCMWGICKACGYPSLKELINENSDYLLNDISLNLQRLSQHPQAPRVLTVMLTHSDCSMLPLVGDIVQDVLTALDLSYDHTAALFCSVLHALMKALGKTAQGMLMRRANVKSVVYFKLRVGGYYKSLCVYALFSDVPPVSEPDVDDIGGPDVKKELPNHLQITKDVMERCIHLMSDPNLRLRLKVLDVLELCIAVLSEMENELLPMVHRCWPALLQRLTADDPLAVLRAFRVLCTLGETCGDFLRRRVSKEVLPKLCSSLVRQAPVSARAGPVYSHTLAFKLQLAVLEGMGSLCQRLDLGEEDLDKVCEACLLYLSCRQPARLQEACLSVFRHLIQVDPDTFWFVLNELHCPSDFSPPHPDLRPVRLSGMGRPRDEYTDNVMILLREEFDSQTAMPGS
uniref:Uncharacterized protein n=1 Tax=Periophthalmus magnuspinnatus TaxID=409849 RepID=A0A3B4ALZ5_9GOBI